MLSSQLHSPGRRSLIYWRMPGLRQRPLGVGFGLALLSEPLGLRLGWGGANSLRSLSLVNALGVLARIRFAPRTTEGLQLGLIHFSVWIRFAL